MAIVRAVKTGNWSDTTVWNTGALPTSADDVYSNTFTVTIDTSPTVLSISNATATGVTAGGSFSLTANGITLSALVTNGTTGTCLVVNLASGNTANIIGNISAATNSGSAPRPCTFTGAGTLNITGNITGAASNGANNGMDILSGATGTVNITGNISGGSSGGNNRGLLISGPAIVNITGGVYGSNNSSGSGYGIDAAANAVVTITGSLIGGSSAAAYNTTSSHSLVVIGSLTPANGVTALNANTLLSPQITGPINCSANGTLGIYALRWLWYASSLSSTYFQFRVNGTLALRPLYTADSVGGNPAVGNVRSGTVFGPANELTGTCAVPAAASVASGVPVDATTGTAVITAATLRSAMGLASANLDTQLAAIPTTAAPSASTIATAVWAVATSALSSAGTIGKLLVDNINATVSSAAADSSGVTTLLSRLSSTRATNLDNLDATVSSRSTYAGADTSGTTTLLSRLTSTRAGYLDNLSTAPPSASTIASAVWAAGSRTLTTTIATASDIASAVWNALTANFTTNNTFGAKILIASNTQREVAVTGSHHVAADIHELQPTVINATHFATGALDSVRTSIGLASANLDTQLDNIPTASENASAVRTELSTELSRIDANVSSRLASTSYQSPLDASGTRSALGMATANLDTQLGDIPTTSENASAVRTELSTELGRIDTAISTRLADNDYTAPPTASDNADAVWSSESRTITGGTVDTLTNSPDVPTEVEIAQAVRTELSTELSNIDASISSRLADADYQLPLDASSTRSALGLVSANLDDQLNGLPTALENASATRTELSTELSRIDAAVSTRLPTSSYTAPPTANNNADAVWTRGSRTITGGTVDTLTNSPDVPSPEEIASQVRTELSTELSRVSNTATTQEVADIIEGALSSDEG